MGLKLNQTADVGSMGLPYRTAAIFTGTETAPRGPVPYLREHRKAFREGDESELDSEIGVRNFILASAEGFIEPANFLSPEDGECAADYFVCLLSS